ncbi:MAG: hypothetical protein ACHQIF_14160 [Steroidobacterales bacterium]
MLDLYVLYACVHLIAGKHTRQRDEARCVEAQVYFHAEGCRQALARGGEPKKSGKHPQSWLECQETRAESWIAADATDSGSRVYKAEASVSDANELAALLAPLSPQARATLLAGDLKGGRLQRAFQGPGDLSFFLVGTGSRLTIFAVTHLDDFQFADMATDLSSATQGAAIENELDVETMAEEAGIGLSYHTEMVQRAGPPPGGVVSEP